MKADTTTYAATSSKGHVFSGWGPDAGKLARKLLRQADSELMDQAGAVQLHIRFIVDAYEGILVVVV